MILEQQLRQSLLTDATTAKLATGGVHYQAPQKANAKYPRVTLLRLSTDPVMTLGGATSLTKATVQVDSWSQADYGQAKTLAATAQGVLTALRGTVGTVTFDHVALSDDQDDKNPPAGGTADTVYRVFQVYDVWFYAA